MFEYLNDTDFLQKLDKLHMRTQYAKIILLSFKDEKPLKEIQGNITAGNLSVNGSSSVRRTINLTMLASIENSNLEDIDNEISINKKVKVYVGYKNPLKDYAHYGEIIWFPCGVFVLSSANISRSTSGWNISISGKDKMCLLDGTAGGRLPASTTFHEKLIYLDNGDIEIQYPTIFQIIFEAVNHWGRESVDNIIITDIDDEVKMLVKYMGDAPIYFSDDYQSLSFGEDDDFPHMYIYGQDTGYKYTDFTYPGELVLNAGDTVVTLLDKIVKTLGNYEYFYDINGRFIFQEIKNYLNSVSPLEELSPEDYVRSYNNAKFLYSLTDLDTTTQVSRNPKFDDVKNDFYVWGQRTTSSGAEISIRYHLAIDDKPIINLDSQTGLDVNMLAGQYMWEVVDSETGYIVRYDCNNIASGYSPSESGYVATLVGSPCDEWREELYRRALVAQVTNSEYDTYYDSELLAEWRGLYDPINENWNATNHWNPDVFNDPGSINFWLDFIDATDPTVALGKYSIKNIGRRTKVVNNTDIKVIYNSEVPDVVFIEGLDQDLIVKYQGIGQRFFVLTKEYYDLFSISSTGSSCFDQIREMMYQNLCYNTTISLTCLPKYYMEPNNIIRIEDRDSNIYGNYQITQFSLPLAYNGTMSITATEVLTRV